MAYHEAMEDGVRIENTNFMHNYYPLCCDCGAEVKSISYLRGINYRCKECRLQKNLFKQEKAVESDAETKERKYSNAVDRINQKIKKNKSEYASAMNCIHKKLHNYGWFDSTEEIMVAIELVKNKIKAKHQFKIGSYRIDFLLPDLKVVLEVDGVCFHNERTKAKEAFRDNTIINKLGYDWEVIRITDKSINENITKLLPAIHNIIQARKKARANNKGILPVEYIDRKYKYY